MKWISVKDRMPINNEDILLFVKEDNIASKVYVGRLKEYKENKVFTVYGWDDSCFSHSPAFESITHWMPLPEKPNA